MDINWTVNKSVEIKLKNHFQDKTCGLCGNFNLDPEDEFQTKRSKMLTNVNQFANSFKVGKNVLCPKKSQRTKSLEKLVVKTGEDTVKKVNGGCVFPSIADQMIATRICDRMRQRYPQCVGKISAETAYQQCESNVCSCKRDKQCQCLALEQYINTCNSIDGKFLKTSMCRCEYSTLLTKPESNLLALKKTFFQHSIVPLGLNLNFVLLTVAKHAIIAMMPANVAVRNANQDANVSVIVSGTKTSVFRKSCVQSLKDEFSLANLDH